MNDKYILDEKGNPQPEPDLMKWARWYESQQDLRGRIVKADQIGDSKVSTIFLALDHAYNGGPPVLWETMVFGGPMNQEQDRCSGSREQAEAMHAKMVERVKTTPTQ